MKHQIPTSKLHKPPARRQSPNSNHQAPEKLQNPSTNGKSVRGTVNYRTTARTRSIINEDSPGKKPDKHPFDLEERTAGFGEAIIRFAKKIPRNPVNNRLIDQLVGCGTSVGGNYCEADERVSKKDFHNSVGRCAKEAKETKFFLRMVAAAEPGLAEEARELFLEAKALHLIFASIFRK